MGDTTLDVSACRRMFADFARHAATRAPLYAELSAGIADDPALAALLLHAAPSQRQPVLLFASVHWLLLGDPTDPLARFYPNLNHGARPRRGAIDAWRRFCSERTAEIEELLGTRQTQTNEVGRSALLLPVCGLLHTELGTLAHVDVGASAGLNLLMPRYDYHYEPGGSVTCGSPVVLRCGTRGEPPVPRTHPAIIRAIGLDTNPVDLTDVDQARWLEACVWPDQVERFERLAAAIALANVHGVDVRPGDAVHDVAAAVDEAAGDGAAHPVVTTSWVLNYLRADERLAFVTELDRIGAECDVSWVYVENPSLCRELPGAPARDDGREPTALVLVRWRSGRRTVTHLADADPHGRWLHWRGAD